jgi:membrane carboxypeptidase/penicillin-binding protein
MKTTQTIKGRISGHFNGLGTVTPSMVEQRAKEIALINGRTAEQVNKSDREEAQNEMTGDFATAEQRDENSPEIAATLRDINPTSSGHKVAALLPSDEQQVAEQLVREGVDEAEHHSMLAGSTRETNQNS